MSALLGTHWPVNSVGVLPDVDPHKDGYLRMRGEEREIAEAAVVNAKVKSLTCPLGMWPDTELGNARALSSKTW
jgi:hypothetical protein